MGQGLLKRPSNSDEAKVDEGFPEVAPGFPEDLVSMGAGFT